MNLKFKKWIYACLTTLSIIPIKNANAQCVELINNGGFETITTTPPYTSQPGYPSFMPYATGWDQHNVPNYNGTPDLFTTSSPSNPISPYNSVHIPCNYHGYQAAHTGNSYAGLLTVVNDNSFSGANCTEFITTNFSSTLTAGKIYEISLWVSRADLANNAINGLGVWIGTSSINAQADAPTYNCPTTLSNNDAWTQITFPYCANGDETLIIIGGSSTTYGAALSVPSSTCSQNSISGAGAYVYIDDVSVKEVTFAVPTQTLCAKQTGTFTAVPTCSTITTSALTYTWNYGDGSAVVTTNTLNVTTHSYAATPTGMYTASLTVGNGTCATTFTYNVIIPNVTTAITTNTTTICNGNTSFTATPNPAGTYTVSWGLHNSPTYSVIPGTSYTVTNGATLTPSINFANINENVYVLVTVTSTLGCQYTDSLFMPSCCATPTNVVKHSNKTFTVNTTISTGTTGLVSFGGTITVNNNITLTLLQVNAQLDPNTKFVLNGNGKVRFVNSYVHGCNYMWDGIYPIATGTVDVLNSIVEDAKRVAIDSLGGATILFTNSYINKNNMGIALKANKTSTSAVTVKNVLFTCSNVSIPTGANKTPAITPNLTNASTLGAFTTTVMLAPYNTLKSFCGIYSAGAAHTGKANSAIVIGGTTGQENVFDKMQYGAYDYVSNMVFQNNVFQNIKNSIVPVTSGSNTAVFVLGPFFGGGSYYTQIGGASSAFKNTFKDNDYGVASVLPSGLLVQYNKFETQTNGVYVNSNSTGKVANIRNNNFYQNNIGVNCYNNTYITSSIKDNNFDNTASAVGTYADNYAIRCTEATLATSTSSYPAFDIDNNKISGFYNGIYTSQTLLPIIYDNEVHMRSDNTTDHWQQGINATNTNSATINNNIVDMSSYNQWAYWQIGINLSTNQVPKAQCNSVNNVNMAIAAGGSNLTPANDGIKGNYLQNANFGVWLVNNGQIGNQAGSTGSNSSDNAWASTCAYYTYAQNNSNLSSHIFFTRSGGGYDLPLAKTGNINGSISMLGNNNSAASTGSCNVNAATPSNAKLSGAASLASLMQTAEDIAFDYNQTPNFSLSATANLTAADDINDNEVNRKAILRKQLLSNIVLQQVDVQDSKELTAFMAAVTTENTGLLFAVDSLIHFAEKDSTKITAAENANASITPNNKVEQSQQQFNDLYLAYLAQNKTLNNSEVSNLETIAQQCPMFYGTSVYQARAVLFDLKRQNYISACENVSPNASSKRIGQTIDNFAQTTDIIVYPNPANTVVFIDAKNHETVVLKLYDVMGHLVIDKTVASTEKIDINNLSNGIYIYKLYHNDTELKVGKLIITH
jgi:hypothetical protein